MSYVTMYNELVQFLTTHISFTQVRDRRLYRSDVTMITILCLGLSWGEFSLYLSSRRDHQIFGIVCLENGLHASSIASTKQHPSTERYQQTQVSSWLEIPHATTVSLDTYYLRFPEHWSWILYHHSMPLLRTHACHWIVRSLHSFLED